MPLPERNQGETREQFIDRCMADPVMAREFPDAAQRRSFLPLRLSMRPLAASSPAKPASSWMARAASLAEPKRRSAASALSRTRISWALEHSSPWTCPRQEAGSLRPSGGGGPCGSLPDNRR